MKSKWIVILLAVAVLFGQGLAFAETNEDVVVVEEDIIVDPMTGDMEDVWMAEDPATGMVVEDDTMIVGDDVVEYEEVDELE